MIIKAEQISKSYYHKKIEIDIIKDFSHTFESGKLYVIKGASGRGKTTLLSMIGLLQKPDKGEIFFGDRIVTNLSEGKKAKIRNEEIGIIFQDYNLFHELTVLDNVILAQVCTKKQSMEAAIIQAKEYLELLGLAEKVNIPAKLLSGGEQQRTSIARAIIKNSFLLICDEPVSNLDESNTSLIVHFIDELCHKKNKIAIISSHEKSFDEFADEIIEL